MNTKTALSPKLYFSYSQFMVYDQSVRLPGCAWTAEHTAQGFARRESTVNFNTPLEFGYADVAVARSAYQGKEEYERVIAVPFLVTSGKVIVEGPEETKSERSFSLPAGNYRLLAAQRVTGDEEEVIDLFFEPLTKPLEQSTILVADGALNPPTPLLETAGIAGES
jgi:hypothetical protein